MRREFTTAAIAFALSSATIGARQLTPSEALDRISPDIRLNTLSVGRTDRNVTPILTKESNGLNTLYIFNHDNGFIIVSADDAADKALLGFGTSGPIEKGRALPPPLEALIESYSQEIALCAASEPSGTGGSTDADDTREDIEPFVATTWDQTAPYNDQCPEINGSKTLVGCVALAMGQAMAYYKYPDKGTGSNSYTPYTIGHSLTVDFSTQNYHWDNMANSLNQASPAGEIEEVAHLLYNLGVSVNMEYSLSSSGAYYPEGGQALIDHFGYDKGMRFLHKNYFTYEEWTDMLYAEIKSGRPVLYGGSSTKESHAFVCSGYRKGGYFHFNWGYGGWLNGYFQLSALNPQFQTGIGDTEGFNNNQQMLIGIQPDAGTQTPGIVLEFSSDFEVRNPIYSRTEGNAISIYDSRGIINQSYGTIDAIFGLRLTDESGNISYAQSVSPVQLSNGQAVRTIKIPVDSFPQTGSYIVEPVVRIAGGNWVSNLVKLSCINSLKLTATPEELIFSAAEEPVITVTDLNAYTVIMNNRQCGISATLTNHGTEEYVEDIYPALETDEEEVALAEKLTVDLEPGYSAPYKWIGRFNRTLTPGQYTLFLVDKYGKKLSQGIKVTVDENTTENEEFTTDITFGDNKAKARSESSPAEIESGEFKAAVTVNCTSGFFSDNVGALVFNGPHGVVEVYGQFIALKAGQSYTVDLSNDGTWLQPETTYTLYAYGPSHDRFATSYFRLSPAGIETIDAEEKNINLYPVPATARISVSADGVIENADIYSMSGTHILTAPGNGTDTCTVGIETLPQGVYIMKIALTGNPLPRIGRFVKH